MSLEKINVFEKFVISNTKMVLNTFKGLISPGTEVGGRPSACNIAHWLFVNVVNELLFM